MPGLRTAHEARTTSGGGKKTRSETSTRMTKGREVLVARGGESSGDKGNRNGNDHWKRTATGRMAGVERKVLRARGKMSIDVER